MPKWEYMTLSVLKSYGLNYRVNGAKVADWKDKPLHEVLSQIGTQGYELTVFDGSQYVFKRAAAPATPRPKETKEA